MLHNVATVPCRVNSLHSVKPGAWCPSEGALVTRYIAEAMTVSECQSAAHDEHSIAAIAYRYARPATTTGTRCNAQESQKLSNRFHCLTSILPFLGRFSQQ